VGDAGLQGVEVGGAEIEGREVLAEDEPERVERLLLVGLELLGQRGRRERGAEHEGQDRAQHVRHEASFLTVEMAYDMLDLLTGGTRMPESIPAPLIIDTLKDTFREARQALAAEAQAPSRHEHPGWVRSVPHTHTTPVLAALGSEA